MLECRSNVSLRLKQRPISIQDAGMWVKGHFIKIKPKVTVNIRC